MSSSFSSLKKSRGNFNNLLKEVEKVTKNTASQTKSYKDERYWNITRDAAGNGSAVIRFLPPTEGEDVSFVRKFSHGFKGPTGRWYIEDSLTTLNQADPVTDHNMSLWSTGREEDKNLARSRKRRLSFISNILVINDPAVPENNGKVFLFKYGKSIFDMLVEKTSPTFEDEEKMNPFDPWTGANFKIRIRMADGYPKFDKSTFDSASALFDGDDDLIEEMWKKQYKLMDVVAPSEFKSYDELKKRFDYVVGASYTASTNSNLPSSSTPKSTSEFAEHYEDDDYAEHLSSKSSKPSVKATKPVTSSDDEDDDLEYFKKFADIE